MPFQRPTLEDLVTRVQGDLTTRLALPGAVLRRSVIGILARVLAGAVHGLYGYLDYVAKQIFPDTAEVTYLERHASLYGLARTPASFAAGVVTFTGTDGTVIPEDTRLLRPDGVEFATTGSSTIASGTGTASVQALLAGAAGNTDTSVQLSCISPIAGVDATATMTTAADGGTDAESDDALRERVLIRMRQPPHGGNATDYVAWALAVAGVTRAWVYPGELGPGTVTVRFVRDLDGDGTAILPSSPEVATVQAAIDALRPVTADVTVVAPTSSLLNMTLSITPDTSATRATVTAELEDLLQRLASPGSTIPLSQLEIAVGTAEGVTDFGIASPGADVTHTTGQLAILGTLTWT